MGKFQGRVVTEWLRDTSDDRLMRLEEDFIFIDDNDIQWVAPKGSITDGASIPRYLWSIMGPPLSGRYRRAAVIHDVYCKNQDRPYPMVHKMFHEAMLVDRVGPIKAQLMYTGVKIGGPKWPSIIE